MLDEPRPLHCKAEAPGEPLSRENVFCLAAAHRRLFQFPSSLDFCTGMPHTFGGAKNSDHRAIMTLGLAEPQGKRNSAQELQKSFSCQFRTQTINRKLIRRDTFLSLHEFIQQPELASR